MPLKMSGKEFKEFYASDWGADVWVDDDYLVTVDGRDMQEFALDDEVPDTAVVTIHGGVLYRGDSSGQVGSLVKFARDWKKRQLVSRVVCEVPKEHYDAFVKVVLGIGGKVLS